MDLGDTFSSLVFHAKSFIVNRGELESHTGALPASSKKALGKHQWKKVRYKDFPLLTVGFLSLTSVTDKYCNFPSERWFFFQIFPFFVLRCCD